MLFFQLLLFDTCADSLFVCLFPDFLGNNGIMYTLGNDDVAFIRFFDNIYYSYDSEQYVLNGNAWEKKTWDGLTSFYGSHVWTDGTNIYYSKSDTQYVLNGDTWEPKTWNGLTSFDGRNIWTDGINIYYSYDSDQYVIS